MIAFAEALRPKPNTGRVLRVRVSPQMLMELRTSMRSGELDYITASFVGIPVFDDLPVGHYPGYEIVREGELVP